MEGLRILRRSRGMTQAELAKKAGLTQHTISEIEIGRREARPSTLRKLADALDVAVSDLFAAGEPMAFPKADGPSLAEQLLRDGPGHAYILDPIQDVIAEAEGMGPDDLRARLDALRAEHAFLKALEGDRGRFRKSERDLLKKVRRGFLVRALNLATIGGLAEQDRDRIVAEAA